MTPRLPRLSLRRLLQPSTHQRHARPRHHCSPHDAAGAHTASSRRLSSFSCARQAHKAQAHQLSNGAVRGHKAQAHPLRSLAWRCARTHTRTPASPPSIPAPPTCVQLAQSDTARTFHVLPSAKNSFFQMGTTAFSSSIAQCTACSGTRAHRPSQTSSHTAPGTPCGGRAAVAARAPYLERLSPVRRRHRDDHAGLAHEHRAHAVRDGHLAHGPARAQLAGELLREAARRAAASARAPLLVSARREAVVRSGPGCEAAQLQQRARSPRQRDAACGGRTLSFFTAMGVYASYSSFTTALPWKLFRVTPLRRRTATVNTAGLTWLARAYSALRPVALGLCGLTARHR
jgi:hypothetical protein